MAIDKEGERHMQEFRSNLKRLQVQLETKLPDNDILFDHSGVNKRNLLSAINVTYTLSQSIDDVNDEVRSEVISLKRFGNEAYQYLMKYLERDFRGESLGDEFNEFLNRLSSLIERTKLTYSAFTKKHGAKC